MFRSLFLVLCPLVVCFGADEFSLAGRVVDGTSGEPIKNALVNLRAFRPKLQRAVLTDVTGAFRIEGLGAAVYILNGEKPGYENATEQAQLGPSRDNLVLKLSRLGVIRGRVTTSGREPAARVTLQLWKATVNQGRREFSRTGYSVTDDRGEYLLADVLPGEYVLHAAGRSGGTASFVGASPPRGEEDESFAAVFYGGGTSLPTAMTVRVESGKELRADFSVTMLPAYRLSGVISGMTPYRPVTLLLLTSDLTAVHTRQVVNAATGEFRVFDVIPGSYILRATQRDGQQFTVAETPVVVAGEPVRNIQMELAAGVDIPVDVQGLSRDGRPVFASLLLSPVTPISSGKYGAFASHGKPGKFQAVTPGRYRVSAGAQTGCVHSITAGADNLLLAPEILVTSGITPAPITVVVSQDCGSVTAKLSSSAGDSHQRVVLLPADGSEPISSRMERPDIHLAENVRPGEYTVFQCASDFPYAEAEMREKSGIRGQRVRIEPGRSTTIQLEPLP